MCKPIFSLFLTSVLYAGCGSCGGGAPEHGYVRPVKVATVHAVGYVDKDFAGMATADDATNLAFKIAGQVSSVDVAKGDYVARGALLAQLDPRDVQLKVDADRSLYEKASSQLSRMRRLLDHEAVSRQEYESAQTSYVQAKSAYENSKDLLVDTKLRAPFDGVVERTYVDTYERVQAGQTVVRLVNPVSSTVEFTMPERGMPFLSDTTTRFFVTFDSYPGRRFAARLDSYAKTSSDASGFPVSLRIDSADAERFGISPGMTCSVMMRTSENAASVVGVPLTAVYAPAEGGTYVWCITDDGRVERREVVTGGLFGRDMVMVESGLKAGEKVVTAGVYRLRDGEEVKILNQ